MKYYVYYTDDYYEMGGIGLECFDTEALALAFIRERLGRAEKPNVANYRIIKGDMLKLEPFERVLDVKIGR